MTNEVFQMAVFAPLIALWVFMLVVLFSKFRF